MSTNHDESTAEYRNAETLLPFGDLLTSIRGTDKAVRVGWYSEGQCKRDYHWVAHMPNYESSNGEFLTVRISTNVGGVTYLPLEDAAHNLEEPTFYEWELVAKDIVDIDRTPIPYKKEDRLSVECPECDRWGQTHPWKLDDYVPDVCPCGYEGEWDVY